MSLTVAGDFAWPQTACVDIDGLVYALGRTSLVVNLEGALLDGDPSSCEVVSEKKYNLHSVADGVAVLSRLNVAAAGLGNNHISDYKRGSASTVEILQKSGVSYFGLERCPFTDVQIDNITYRLLGAVSPLTQILSDGDGPVANVFDPDSALKWISRWRRDLPALKIVVFVHWGYELTRYPLPADRAWARRAIAEGADFVIGHHPHVVQGVERIGNGIAAYSLGNCILPQVKYRGKHLSYPEAWVQEQLAITLDDDPVLVWTRYVVAEGKIVGDGTERLSASHRIKRLTPFEGMTDKEYRGWFRRVRREGRTNLKASRVVLWSYFGAWKLHLGLAFVYLNSLRYFRALLMEMGLHRPFKAERK